MGNHGGCKGRCAGIVCFHIRNLAFEKIHVYSCSLEVEIRYFPHMQWPENIQKKLRNLPDAPGVYLMRGREGAIIYVGKAASLRKRVQSYFRESTFRRADPKIRGLIKSIKDFDVLVLKSEAEALLTEGKLIKEYKPRYNSFFKDDKRFPLLRIDLHKPFPMFGICRIEKKDGAEYFGPYASAASARAALEFVEKRFGLRRCRPAVPDAETYKHCHNDIIRHCSAPCVGKVTPDEYRELVETACAFLRGGRPEFIKEIRSQMEAAATAHNFEEAAALRDMMLLLHRAVKERALVRKTGKMRSDDARAGLDELARELDLDRPPHLIECFDISNISGTYAVASMVAAIDGVPAPQRYRRFRIKTVEGSDDPRMMAEAVRRRYSRLLQEQGAMPDLLIVDGGITQLRAARAVLTELGMDLPSAGLAKQFEELVRDEKPSLRLPKDSPARAVVTGLRDEAHRFAISYHRELRRKRIQESALDEIPGIGKKAKERLLSHFGSFARLRKAGLDQLLEVPGIGPKTARMILDATRESDRT
jgi:excinuclease ABC subunit C